MARSALVLAAAGCDVAINYLHARDEAEPLTSERVTYLSANQH
jgi:hypothetical protein